MKRHKPLVCICGPSGTGKTAIGRTLESTYGWQPVVSHTTRPKRPNEIDGVDYRFVDERFFKENIRDFDMDLTKFNGYFYGASRQDLFEKDFIVMRLEDAVDLRVHHDLDVLIVWVNGPCREDRKRSEDMAMPRDYNRYHVNHVLNNKEGRSLDWCAGEIVAVLACFHQDDLTVSCRAVE